MDPKTSWLDRLPWKTAVGSFIAGMIALSWGFGFMSEGTHRERQEEALRPVVAELCAAQFATRSDFDVLRAKLVAGKDSYSPGREIPDDLAKLPGARYRDDKIAAACAKLIVEAPVVKAALIPGR